MLTHLPRSRFIHTVTWSYLVFGLLWIGLSDRLLVVLPSIESIAWLSAAKGVFFVLATTATLFLALEAVPAGASPRPVWPVSPPGT